MKRWALKIACLLLLGPTSGNAAEELNLEFLEWLGQTTEVEEMGVDVNKWLLSKEQKAETDEAEVKSQ